jgi:hemerythrin-like metal-binding protein
MDIIKWRESYATGIVSMDEQHEELIGLINKLYRVITKNESSDAITEVLDQMTTYAEKHLQEEEALLEANAFADYSEHLAGHQDYRDKLEKLLIESQKGDGAAVKETYTFLRQWWIDHIVAEDQKYGEFLKSKGVQ